MEDESPLPSPDATAVRSATSVLLLGFLGALYLAGLIELCRQSLLVEALLSLALPVLAGAAGWFRFMHPRVLQLLLIESIFNLVAITSKGAIAGGYETLNRVCTYGFLLFFVLQLGGFIAFQIKRRKPHGVVQSVTAALLIGGWWMGAGDAVNVVDADGRLLVWGTEAPLAVLLYYVVWVINVMLVDSPALPWLRTVTLHSVSVALCLMSGEFFHARLLTACHLFFLDLTFGYAMKSPQSLGLDFAVIPRHWIPGFKGRVQPVLAWCSSLGCIALLVGSAILGLDLTP